MSEYTPSTHEMRNLYMDLRAGSGIKASAATRAARVSAGKEFDRWLAAVEDTAVRKAWI